MSTFERAFDGLSGLVHDCFGQVTRYSGHLFPLLNRRRDRIKLLYFDRDGLAIWYKRLEAGSYQMPQSGAQDGIELQPAQLAMCCSQESTCGQLCYAANESDFRSPAESQKKSLKFLVLVLKSHESREYYLSHEPHAANS